MLLGKAFIVTASWVFTFHALSHLPLSIAAPIRASAPLFTILLAVSFMGERPSGVQWFGIILLFLSYYTFSVAGKKETGSFWNNRWVIFMFIGTLLGALSGIYDKFLIQSAWISPTVVQVWFSVYLTLLQGVILGFWTLFAKQKKTKFKFRWIILLVGGFLVIADRLYFMALNEPGALISTVSVIRRTNVIVSFCGGIFLWKEKLIPVKLLAFTGIMTGLIIIGLG